MLATPQQQPARADEYDLQTALQARLASVLAEKETLQFSLKDLEKEIQNHIRGLPKRIPQSDEELDRLIEEKQFKHQTSTQSKEEERKLLKEIDKLRQTKKQLAEYNAMQDRIDELKRRRTAMQEDLRNKETSSAELQQGLKKMQLAVKLGIHLTDLVEDLMPVPADAIPRIVGKNWGRLHDLEEQFGVVIDIDRPTLTAKITGTTSGVLAARDKIAVIIDTVTEEVSLSEVQIVTLLHSRAARINQLSAQFDVRIDANLAGRTVRITGQTANVAAAREAVLSVDARVDTVKVEESLRGALIGKGGSNIRQLQEQYGVQIDLSKEDGTITITGPVEGVRQAGEYVRSFIDENQETEVVMEGQRSAVLTSIVGKNGETIKNLQREMGVAIKVDRKEEGEDKKTKEEPSAMVSVVIRGPVSKIQAARQRLLGLLSMCDQQSVIVPVPDRVLPVVIGKKGATVQALRQKYPNATIDVDWTLCCVRIHSASDDERQAVREEIENIVEQNFSVEVPIDDDLSIALKGNRGADTRKQISDLKVNMEIDSAAELVRLRGPREAVYEAANALRAFIDNNHSLELPLELDDESALLSGGEKSLIHRLQQEMAVEIHILRKLHLAKLRGQRDAVHAARDRLRKILEGDVEAGSALVMVEPEAMGSVIGKSGANIKAVEKRFNVEIDLLRTRHQIRLRGEPEGVLAAKEHLLRFMCTIRVTETIPSPAEANQDALADILRAIGQRYFVQAEKVGEHITIRGGLYDVSEARSRLLHESTGTATCVVPIVESHGGQLASSLAGIADKSKASVQLTEKQDAVEISGPLARVEAAKAAVYRMLDALFPFNYNQVSAESAALHAVGNHANLQLIHEATGAHLKRDVESGCVRIYGSESQVHAATDKLKEVFQTYQDTHASLPFDEDLAAELRSDKQAARLRNLGQQHSAEIKISERTNAVKISAADRANLLSAVDAAAAFLQQVRREMKDIPIEEGAIGRVLGKGGALLKTMQTKHKCSINLDRNANVVRIRGSEEGVQSAADEIEAIIRDWKESNYQEEIFLPGQFVAALIGPGGSNIRQVQSQFRVKIDVRREKESAVISGHKNTVQQAREAIVARLGSDYEATQRAHEAQKAALAKRDAAKAEPAEEKSKAVASFPVVPPGAPQDLVERLTGASKSKRRRKKNKAGADGGEDEGSFEPAPRTPSPAPVEPAPPAVAPAVKAPAVTQSAQPIQPVQPVQPAPAVQQANGHSTVAQPAALPSVDRGIYAAPPPGLEEVAAVSRSPASGKSDDLLAMLLGDGHAASASSSGAAAGSSTAGASAEKVEYYMSSSGFSIRL